RTHNPRGAGSSPARPTRPAVRSAAMAFGLVMGGGGVVGIAWEIGVVEALAQAGALDPSAAATIVGTSAGSVVGTQLAAGVDLDALVAAQLTPAQSVGGGAAAPDMTAVMKIFGGMM